MASAFCRYLLPQRWFFMDPLFLDSLSQGPCHNIFALNVEFCPLLVLPVFITEKAHLLNFEHLVSKTTLPMDPPTCSAPCLGCREGCTALQWLMHPLPWANGVSQAAGLWLLAMDRLSWHLSFSLRVNKFHHCFNFPP